MSAAIAIRDTDTMAEWGVMRQQAEVLVKTNFLPKSIKTPEQAVAIILTGRELGIGTMAALNNINVIAGKPTIPPQLMLALINRTGQLEDISITDDGQACKVTMKRRGRQAHTESFSMKDAALMKTQEDGKTIPLTDKYNWRQMPAIMRKWRAVAACARVVFPDVILGLYTPDEMGAQTDGETGELVALPVEEAQPVPALPADHGIVVTTGEVFYAPEPEPVRPVRLEGAQPTPKPSNGKRHAVLAYAEDVLKWTPEQLIDEIDKRFSIAINPERLNDALPMMPAATLKELDQVLKAEFNNRSRTR